MATKVQLGETGQAVVAGTGIAANTMVDLDTSGLLIVCASGRKPIGVVQDAFAAGATATYYKCRGNKLFCATSGTVVKNDIVKAYTGGLAIADTSSGSTALSVNSVGVCAVAPDSDGNAEIIFF